MIKRGLKSLAVLTLFAGVMLSGSAVAQMAFVEGNDYTLISPAAKTSVPDKVVVTEIFWYGCPHCFRFEPYVEKWSASLPEGVIFEQVPSSLNPRWTEHARAYYSFQMMGALEQTHRAFFDAIHLKRQRLNSVDTIAEFVAERGLDGLVGVHGDVESFHLSLRIGSQYVDPVSSFRCDGAPGRGLSLARSLTTYAVSRVRNSWRYFRPSPRGPPCGCAHGV